MTIDFTTLSHTSGAIAYGLVSLLFLKGYLRRAIDKALVCACISSTIWMAVIASQSLGADISFNLRYFSELVRDFALTYALISMILVERRLDERDAPLFKSIRRLILGFYFLAAILFVSNIFMWSAFSSRLFLFIIIGATVLGLVLVEQAWRNVGNYGRVSGRYLFIALGAAFAYDFVMYTDALALGKLNRNFWEARGAVNTLIALLIAIASINAGKQPVSLQMSRQLVFYTSTLFIASGYLFLVSMGAYYIKIFGGTWGEAFQVFLFFLALIFMLLLLTSPHFRARLMLFISKHFFDYKYDYREEWLRSTNLLMDNTNPAPLEQRVIGVLSSLVQSNHGALWLTDEDGTFQAVAYLNWEQVNHDHIGVDAELINFFSEKNWIIDLRQYRADPTAYNFLEIPNCIKQLRDPWLIVPLYTQTADNNVLIGFCVIGSPQRPIELNWENYDILKVVANQAASFLAQSMYLEKLAQARQFEAVNRTSAFLVHDLKTIIAQLSLLTKNSHKHRSNPAFIDDMIKTTEHTVSKMSHLLQQIRNPETTVLAAKPERVDLIQLMMALVETHRKNTPEPVFSCDEKNVFVLADYDQLFTVIGHILQNAQDATPKTGKVTVNIKKSKGQAFIFIQDNGTGMTREFIKNELFKPFVSTKGLTGMGIGAYQCREYLRKIGGSVEVSSQPGIGTCFTLVIPLEHAV